MRQRGRSARTALAQISVGVVKDDRPDPPACLNAREKEIWSNYVAAMPAGWFAPETRPLLEALCRAQHQLRDINQAFTAFKDGVPEDGATFQRYVAITRLPRRYAVAASQASAYRRLARAVDAVWRAGRPTAVRSHDGTCA
jgi:hypothetical protein